MPSFEMGGWVKDESCKHANRRPLSSFSAFTEFLARNERHRETQSVLFLVASNSSAQSA